jgi:O-antigen ligase
MMLAMRVLDGAAVLILLGWLLARQQRSPKSVSSNYVIVFGTALLVWLVISLATALFKGTPYGTFARHDPSNFVQAAVLFLVTRNALKTRSDCALLAGVVSLTVIARVVLQGVDGIYLESYVATLLVMGAPLALLGIYTAQTKAAQWAFGAGAVTMVGALALTQNRAAAVAAVVVVLVFLWQVRWAGSGKWLAAMGMVVVLGLWFAPSSYVDRFRALLDPAQAHPTANLDRGTANERLELWSAGWHMAKDQPVMGVGPGNYPATLDIYLPGKGLMAAHSNYAQMLAEAGFLGLVLYLAFFGSVLVVLARDRHKALSQWHRRSAQMLQLALVAYLAGGIFNSRADFVFAYVIAGWAMALRDIDP